MAWNEVGTTLQRSQNYIGYSVTKNTKCMFIPIDVQKLNTVINKYTIKHSYK